MRRITSYRPCLLLALCMFAAVRANWWDDFSNNLATDLSPLLALFGEQVTKQFLSESLSLWDNFIFAMAPLGIVTAVVSAIRVCGGPSLRAFIGRAQEGGGVAEAELCSSTSRDVCELYHNGAIVRVFGRPKILEVVHDVDHADFSYGVDDLNRLTPPKCGIYSFKDYVNDGLAEKAGWKETGSAVNPNDEGQPRPGFQNVFRRLIGRHRLGKDNIHDMSQHHNGMFAPNPNLSFNIGIKKYPVYIYWAAAGVGLLSEAAVIVYGAFATYRLKYQKDDALPHAWAFPFMALGTVFLSLGMFWCAFLVERSTQERIFRKLPQTSAKPSSASLYITQPGNQTIGDQTYDAFAFSDSLEELKEYITSWKLSRQSDEQRIGVWFAAGATMLGFIFQFIGLRGLHSSVSIVLLGAIVIMSIVRSSLRTGRLKQERNLLSNRPEEIEGHELDWLAMQMSIGKATHQKREEEKEERMFWTIIPRSGSHKCQDSEMLGDTMNQIPTDDAASRSEGAGIRNEMPIKEIGTESGGIYAFCNKREDSMPREFELSNTEMRRAEAKWLSQMQSVTGPRKKADSNTRPHLARELFYHRSRLAELTTHSTITKSRSSAEWNDRLVPLRHQVRQLKTAIESCTRVIFPNLKPEWKHARSLAWSLNVAVPPHHSASTPECCSDPTYAEVHEVQIFVSQSIVDGDQQLNTWEVDQHSLEAVLGLCVWSIVSNPITELSDAQNRKLSGASEASKYRILALGSSEEDTKSSERMFQYWMKDFSVSLSTTRWSSMPSIHEQNAHTLWNSNGSQKTLSPVTHAGIPYGQMLRLFGWTSAALPNKSSAPETYALITGSTQSIHRICAQDICQSFISEMATILNNIEGSTHEIEENGGFYLANDFVTKLVDSIQESGLASRQDAYLMVIPALSRHSKLPLPASILPKVYDMARQRRQAGEYEDAELMLRWAWDIGLTTENQQNATSLQSTALELGELYRSTYREGLLMQHDKEPSHSPSGKHHHEPEQNALEELGRRGICWLSGKRSTTMSPGIVDVIDRYVRFGDRWGEAQPKVASTADALLQTIIEGDRDQCLFEISRVKNISTSEEEEGAMGILSWAARRGWSEIVNTCLDIGSIVDSLDNSHRTPLSYAAEHGHRDIALILLEHQALPTTNDKGWRTPLSYASQNGHDAVVKLLLADQRVTTETKDKNGWLPLHWAAAGGHCDAIESLCHRKADVDETDLNEKTPFVIALEKAQEQAARLLVKLGATLDSKVENHEAWITSFRIGMFSYGGELLRLVNEKSMNALSGTGENISVSILLQPAPISSSFSYLSTFYEEVKPDISMLDCQVSPGIGIIEVNDVGVQHYATADTLSKFASGRLIVSLWISVDQHGELIRQDQVPFQTKIEGHLTEFLWDLFKPDAKFIADVVMNAAQNPFTPLPLEVLLERAGDRVEITNEMAEATIIPETFSSAAKLDSLLQVRKEFNVTPDFVEAAERSTSHPEALVKVLLRQRPNDIIITENVMKVLVGGSSKNEPLLRSLIHERAEDVIITNAVLKEAAANQSSYRYAKPVWELLLYSVPEDLFITEEVFEAAFFHKPDVFTTPYMISSLLHQSNLKINLTPRLLGKIVDNAGAHDDRVDTYIRKHRQPSEAKDVFERFGVDVPYVLRELFRRPTTGFSTTDDHLRAAVQSKYCSLELVSKLLERRESGIDEKVALELCEVASGLWDGGDSLAGLIATHNSSR